MATLTGKNLLQSIIETTGVEINALIFNTLSAKLQQMIDNGTYSKLAAAIAMSGFSTVINDATEIGDLSDAVETNAALIKAEAEDTNNDNLELLSAAQSKSATISGIDHDTLVPVDNYIVAALYEGGSWLDFQNASDPITYSFNETLPPEYSWSDTSGWQPVASHVRDVIDEVMSITDGFILPDIEKVSNG